MVLLTLVALGALQSAATGELYATIAQLEAEEAALTSAVGQSKRENEGGWPELEVVQRRNAVYGQLTVFEAQVDRRGVWMW